jgi:multicomponent Na+:H+ antiporter subunit G
VDLREVVSIAPLAAGAFFFLAGTLGILRFPDVHSRLHALAKADNLGLGLVILGLIIQAGSPATAVKLAVIWVIALLASASAAYVIAERRLVEMGQAPSEERP